MEGKCALCGNEDKLTFEHVPPQSAFNSKPIFIHNHHHLIDTNSPLYGKRMKSNKGFGSYTLCKKCNNNTGDWYARDFGDFARQGMEIIKSLKEPTYFIVGKYEIKPLNIFKQILMMFMSADKSGHLRTNKALVNFLINKESQDLPTEFAVYLYSTLSSIKRLLGYCVVYDGELGIQKWSEINFQPFGYFLTENSGPAHRDMFNLNSFVNFKFNEEAEIEIKTPYLGVQSLMIGTYS
jgi:hypothetical protein